MKIPRILGLLAVQITVSLGVALAATGPEPLAQGTTSATRLEPGPYAVEQVEDTWIDDTRPISESKDYAGAPDRTLEIALWSAKGVPGPHPLLVYSHGFMSNRHAGSYLVEQMASHGYVIVVTDYRLTHFGAPGGPLADDVVNQLANVSFLIDHLLALGADERRFSGGIDHNRMGY